MAYNYRKPYSVKRKKPILRNRVFRFAVLTLTAIVGISYFLFFSSFFQIKKIIITGDKIISEDNIPRQNIFLIDILKIEKNILGNFSQIAAVDVRRNFPDTLKVLITKRIAQALWCENEKCLFIDDNAMIFEESSEDSNSLIRITGAKELLNKEKIAQLLKIQNELGDGLIATTTHGFIVSEERLNVKTSEGWEIYFNSKGNLNWQIQELKLVLEKQITPEKRRNLEYIDLRFSRVYYK